MVNTIPSKSCPRTTSWCRPLYQLHDVVRGQDLLGIVLTIHHIALPLHLLFCPKQGRYNTNKADLLIFMLSRLQAEFVREGIDLTKIPLLRIDTLNCKLLENQWQKV